MSDRLEAVKAQFDAMIEKMKEEVYRRVDLEMEILLDMWREEKRRKMKKNTRVRTVKRMSKDNAAEDGGGQQSDDNEDSVSIKSEIESDECHCDSDDDNSNFEVKEELPEKDAATPVASTSNGRKRQAMSTHNVAAKKRRVDTERQESTSGNFKIKIISVDCTVKTCKRTFRCGHKMREHLLAVHKVKPFQCRAQGCDEQFDKFHLAGVNKVFIFKRLELVCPCALKMPWSNRRDASGDDCQEDPEAETQAEESADVDRQDLSAASTTQLRRSPQKNILAK